MYQNIDLKTNKKMYSVNLIHAIITELISKTEVNFLLIDIFKKMLAGTVLELKYYCSHIGLQQDQELLLCVLCRQDSHGHGLWRKCPMPCSRLCGKHPPHLSFEEYYCTFILVPLLDILYGLVFSFHRL